MHHGGSTHPRRPHDYQHGLKLEIQKVRLHETFCDSLDILTNESGAIRAIRRKFGAPGKVARDNILPLGIMSDDPRAPCQTFLKIVGHVQRDQRISGSLEGSSMD